MEKLKHECGLALVRLKGAARVFTPYTSENGGLDLILKLLHYQLNRGQEGAGIAVVNPGYGERPVSDLRYVAEGAKAVDEIRNMAEKERDAAADKAPWAGPLFMGHVRYSTTGKNGKEFLHPVPYHLKDEDFKLYVCGNFNLTNPDELYDKLVADGVEVLSRSDAHVVAASIGNMICRARDDARSIFKDHPVNTIEICMQEAVADWDGGFVVAGMSTGGVMWVLRDPHGIRPAFYYDDEHMFIAASERSAIANVAGVPLDKIKPIEPGGYLAVDYNGNLHTGRYHKQEEIRECVFERIYFSRKEDPDIRYEREQLGRRLAPKVEEVTGVLSKPTLLAYVPETARTMYNGLGAEMLRRDDHGMLTITKALRKRTGQRTFITGETERVTLAAGAYELQPEKLPDHLDTLIIVDDSVVRGTTFRDSILRLLEPLRLPRILIVSASPQIRYPDFYGIDMSRLSELIAFRAAVELLKDKGMIHILDSVYHDCLDMLAGKSTLRNSVRRVYELLSEDEISDMIGKMLTPAGYESDVKIIYLPLESLCKAIPEHTGDWCFSGNYATPGALRMLARAYINFYEGRSAQRT